MTEEQLTFSGVLDRPLPAPAQVKPIVKWLGGKGWLVSSIAPGIYRRLFLTGGRYVEPFVGGGALALHLGLPKMIIADACEALIRTYRTVITNPHAVGWGLATLTSAGVDARSYYRVRDDDPQSYVAIAARFIYLNKLCFNAVHRVNKKGKFNVPYGKKFADDVNPFDTTDTRDALIGNTDDDVALFPSGKHLRDFAAALHTSEVKTADFRVTLGKVREGDVVFVDPPYAATFSGYTVDGFGSRDQIDLANQLHRAVVDGATIIATNVDIPEIRELYGWASITPTRERRNVSQDGQKRQSAGCIIITNDQKILGT